MNDPHVRQIVRDKIMAGLLPRDRIGRVSATYGAGEICDACSASVPPSEVLYKLTRAASDGFLFHATCFAVWKEERNSMTSVRAALD